MRGAAGRGRQARSGAVSPGSDDPCRRRSGGSRTYSIRPVLRFPNGPEQRVPAVAECAVCEVAGRRE